MLKNNSFGFGIVIAILVTILSWFLLNLVNDFLKDTRTGNFVFTGVSEQFLASLSVVMNVVPYWIYKHFGKLETMRGVALVAVMLAFVVVIYYHIL